MFNDSKYTSLYFKLIEKFSTEKSQLTESHHIIPKSIGGTNDSANLANVPCRVHFILHKLLPKMVDEPKQKQKMRYAIWRMMNPQTKKHNRTYIITSSDYKNQRDFIRDKMSGDNNPMRRPEIAEKFKRKRPEQSVVASKRNAEYWSTRKKPLVKIICATCEIVFETTNEKRICCCKSCSTKYNNKKRHFSNKVCLEPHSD